MLYGKYTFKCNFESDAFLPPYKGSTFRGVFGHALKRVVCALKRQECEECLLKGRCIYTLVFETKHALNSPKGFRLSAPPHPFVIVPPLTEETRFKSGSSFDFDLLLFGEVNHSIAYFIYAFDQIGKTGIGKRVNGKGGRFRLRQAEKGADIIYSDADRLIKANDPEEISLSPANQDDDSVSRVKISLVTPLRLKSDNRLKADLPFHILVRAMLRRISSLFAFYDGGEPALDYRGMVERAKQVRIVDENLSWCDWRRYSHRQDQAMLMGGMAGSVTYEGQLGEYLPLMEISEKLHLGKQTAFGLGKVQVEKIS
ncbi:conserved hypothetical protein [uncultured Desulfobacterium sp.]|uniref:CRISPR-associated protein Cas6 C-terminal domain-containing protein n=1 Tax=uncultured Desulfobacterium sp. TaxID=201089 RepID=A0A445MU71_9BACT|nr:conserved hypothetical protein [uncultured Desulfobacterium sp.]